MLFSWLPLYEPQKKLWLALISAGLAATSVQAQTAPTRVTPPSSPSQATPSSNSNRSTFPGSVDPGPNPLEAGNATRMQHLREDERRKRLLSDTARLVSLTGELQAEVEKSSRDELSLDVVRKAAEIEKLAHDVRERMKN